jgi:guanylate kinase
MAEEDGAEESSAQRVAERHYRVEGQPGALLVVLSGPSGVGKDTIIRVLKERHPGDRRKFVVTYKTRERRPMEVDKVDYHFVSQDDFDRLRAEDAFLETAEVHGQWSGTPWDQVIEALERGDDAVLKIDVQGARAVRERVQDAVLIFVAPPSMEALSGRLRGRATESEAEFRRRQLDAAVELASQSDYDYVVVNRTGEADETAEEIERIIVAEHERHPDRRVRV